jgi:hypothetical protein
MPGGYADTPGNGPTQSRLTLFARSLEDFIIPGTRTAFRQVRSVFWGRGEVFFVRDARRACRGATCRTACWDFRVPFHAMVGVVVGV